MFLTVNQRLTLDNGHRLSVCAGGKGPVDKVFVDIAPVEFTKGGVDSPAPIQLFR